MASNSNATNTLVELTDVKKTYDRGRESVSVLDGLSLEIPEGAFEALMGPSGSGNSTLLNIVAGLDRPTRGRVIVAGQDLCAMSDGARSKFRARHVGFVFQSFNLIPVLTAKENVELPLLLQPLSKKERRRRAETALRVVNLEHRMHHRPGELSGGQEQRVAIARAIVTDPTLLICDEPTGDLDRKAAEEIVLLMEKLSTEFKKTILIVTHDPLVAERATTTRRLDKGQLQ